MSTDLSDRYGTRRSRGPLVVALAVLVAGAFLGWLAWATWFHATPPVRSELSGFEVLGPAQVRATLDVDLAEDAEEPRCRLRALAADHAVVGEHVFTPVHGLNEVTFRTEREAVSVERIGCTAEGQPRPH